MQMYVYDKGSKCIKEKSDNKIDEFIKSWEQFYWSDQTEPITINEKTVKIKTTKKEIETIIFDSILGKEGKLDQVDVKYVLAWKLEKIDMKSELEPKKFKYVGKWGDALNDKEVDENTIESVKGEEHYLYRKNGNEKIDDIRNMDRALWVYGHLFNLEEEKSEKFPMSLFA